MSFFILPKRRRLSVPRLVRRLAHMHPEFDSPMTWDAVERVCERERIVIRTRALPGDEKGWLVRLGDYVTIRISRTLTPNEKLWTALHELGHFFGEDIGEVCMYTDDGVHNDVEEFCEIFAWYSIDPGARECLDRRDVNESWL